MFNKLKIVALDIVIYKLEVLLANYKTDARVKEYMNQDNTYENNIAYGIKEAIRISRDVRESFVKCRY